MSDFDILSWFLCEFYHNNCNALKRKKLHRIPAQTYVANKGFLQTSVNVFLQCIAKQLYFSLAFMFQQAHTKQIFIKEFFKLQNPTFIKSWGPLTFRHSYKTTQCSINSRSDKKANTEQPVGVWINCKQHWSLSSITLSLYEERMEIETSIWNAFN